MKWYIRYIASIFAVGITAFSVFGILIAITSYRVLPIVYRIDSTSHELLDCRSVDASGKKTGNPNCLPSMIEATGGSIRASSGEIAKAAPVIAASLKQAANESVNASKKTTELMAESVGAVKDLRQLLKEQIPDAITELAAVTRSLNVEVVEQGKRLRAIEEDGDVAVKELATALHQFTELEIQLNEQLQQNSPKVTQTLDAMLAIVQSKHWESALANIDRGVDNGADIIETINIATRDLRKKAALVKTVLLKLASLVHLVYSPF